MGWIGDQVATLRGDDFPAAVLALLSLAMLVVAIWALLVVSLASVPGQRRLAVALTPRLLHGVLLAGVAGSLTVPSAHADERDVGGLRLPDRPTVAASSTPETNRSVVVRPGDTLWAIAEGQLDLGADAATIARACDQWYRANRDVIGPDPDLIRPGQRLAPPSEDHS